MYGLEVWGSACKKYLNRIENFCKRAYRCGYTARADFEISTLIEERDKLLFNKITTRKDHPLQDLLPPKRSRMLRKRGHEFQLPQIRTERYKNPFMNRCLFKFEKLNSITFDFPSLYLIVSYCSFNFFISHNFKVKTLSLFLTVNFKLYL